jgi:hypothetical protein
MASSLGFEAALALMQRDYLRPRMPFLNRKGRFSEFHQLARPSAKAVRAMGSLWPMDATTIENWRNHLPRVAGQISIHGPICQALREFGYEQNDHWLEELEGILPDLSPSRWPEETAPKIWKFWYRKYIEAANILVARGAGIPPESGILGAPPNGAQRLRPDYKPGQ